MLGETQRQIGVFASGEGHDCGSCLDGAVNKNKSRLATGVGPNYG